MKLKLKQMYWSEMDFSLANDIIKPILGEGWSDMIGQTTTEDRNTLIRRPIINWITDVDEIQYLLIKHPHVFEAYDEN